MTSADDVESELKRLKKDDLIRIIMYKKVPSDIVLSEKVVDFINVTEKPTENVGFYDYSSDSTPNLGNRNQEMSILALKCDLRVARIEVDSSKKIISELERSVNNQELIINLLKKGQNQKVIQENTKGKQDRHYNVANSSARSDTPISQERSNKNEQMNVGKEGTLQAGKKTTELKETRPIKKVVWGNNETPNADLSFAAATKRAWIYVGKIKD